MSEITDSSHSIEPKPHEVPLPSSAASSSHDIPTPNSEEDPQKQTTIVEEPPVIIDESWKDLGKTLHENQWVNTDEAIIRRHKLKHDFKLRSVIKKVHLDR
jgi:hypothetical protein